jgi:hypothetical protein
MIIVPFPKAFIPDVLQSLPAKVRVNLGMKKGKDDQLCSGDPFCASGFDALAKCGELLKNKTSSLCIICCVNLISVKDQFTTSMKWMTESSPMPFGEFHDGSSMLEGVSTMVVTTPEYQQRKSIPYLGKFRSVVGGKFNVSTPHSYVMEKALHDADLVADDISYISLHGSGTVEGDQAEFDAFKEVYAEKKFQENSMFVGYLNSTVGNASISSAFTQIIASFLSLSSGIAPGVMNPDNTYKFANGCDFNSLPQIVVPVSTRMAKFHSNISAVHGYGFEGWAGHCIIEVDDFAKNAWGQLANFKDEISCSDPAYIISPSVEDLRSLPHHLLKYVTPFSIQFPNGNSISWIDPVDLRHVSDIAHVAQSSGKNVTVYPDVSTKPERGKGLNRPALVTLAGVECPQGKSEEEFSAILRKRLVKQDAVLYSYSKLKEACCFRVEHFSEYGIDDKEESELESSEKQ